MLELILSSIGTIIANIIIFLSIPFLWWLIKYRKSVSFFEWVGLIKPKLKGKWWVIIIFVVAYYFFYLFDFTIFMDDKSKFLFCEFKVAPRIVNSSLIVFLQYYQGFFIYRRRKHIYVFINKTMARLKLIPNLKLN